MRERWSQTCQEVLVAAKQACIELENFFLGTEHVAMAMLARPNSRLGALLTAHGVSPQKFVDMLYDCATPGGIPRPQNIPLTPRIRQAVRHAEELNAGVGGGAIAEIHLLGGLLASGRGVFVRVLEDFALRPQALMAELAAEISGELAPPQAETMAVARPSKPRVRETSADASVAAGMAAPLEPPPAPSLPRILQGQRPLLPLGRNNPALLDFAMMREPTEKRKEKSQPPKPAETLLERLGRDVTQQAADGELPDVIGRDGDIEQLQRALCRASRNNPLLLGEAGVGKTAVVEGLAQRIAQGNVPGALRGVRIVEIPLAAMTAETKFRGELEERLLQLVDEIRDANVVLLVDDVHALAATGGTGGGNDVGSVLRPFLARGDIRMIGTTTPSAFTRHIERDSALLRCFHPIKMAAPDDVAVLAILRSVRPRFEDFHQVKIPDVTLESVIRFAHAYLKQRHMPDVAIDLLDEACVKAVSLEALADEALPPLVRPSEVAAVVAQRTGIPLESLTREERKRMTQMEDELRRQVIGQDDAVRRVSERVRMFKAGFREDRRPLGVFLFLGPTGVGKTELARALARFLFDTEEHLYRLDMSEFSEPHEVARLIGPPPGYVGFGEEGQLTGAVRRDPHCVILLDEIEKANPKVFDLFLQVFDDGRLTDGKGVTTDFTHAIIVLTSNLGADLWQAEKRIGFRQETIRKPAMREARAKGMADDTIATDDADAHDEEDESRRKRIFDTLKGTFRLEFLNRLDEVILFRPLDTENIRAIARQMVARWQTRSTEQGHPFEVDEAVFDFLCIKGYEPDLGARPMKRAIEQYVVAPLSRHVLQGEFDAAAPLRARIRDGRVVFEAEA